jgi:hypothetical protein
VREEKKVQKKKNRVEGRERKKGADRGTAKLIR